jgi:hypothetical protein
MSARLQWILVALLFGFVLVFVLAVASGQGVVASLYGGLMLTAAAGVLAAPLVWAADVARDKGYGAWLGLLLFLVLNFLGLLLLWLLPSRRERGRI